MIASTALETVTTISASLMPASTSVVVCDGGLRACASSAASSSSRSCERSTSVTAAARAWPRAARRSCRWSRSRRPRPPAPSRGRSPSSPRALMRALDGGGDRVAVAGGDGDVGRSWRCVIPPSPTTDVSAPSPTIFAPVVLGDLDRADDLLIDFLERQVREQLGRQRAADKPALRLGARRATSRP